MKYWFVVHTHPNSEQVTKQNLERQGFNTYFPVYRRQIRHSRKTKSVLAPLFPRYVFVFLDPESPGWSRIKFTRGVSKIVCFGEKPAKVPQLVVDGLRERENTDGLFSFGFGERFLPGEQVNIVSGLFGNQSGKVEKLTGAERVLVLLNILGKKIKLNTPLDHISTLA